MPGKLPGIYLFVPVQPLGALCLIWGFEPFRDDWGLKLEAEL